MGSLDKTLNAILSGVQDASISFGDLVICCWLLDLFNESRGTTIFYTARCGGNHQCAAERKQGKAISSETGTEYYFKVQVGGL